MGVEIAKHHLVSTILQKGVKISAVVSRARERRGDVYIDEGQFGSPKVSLDCQDFRRIIVGKNVTIRHPIGDEVVDESNKSSTAASCRAITPDSGIAGELLERGVHAEFCLLHAGDQHLVTMQEVQQFSVAVQDAVAIELQEPTSL